MSRVQAEETVSHVASDVLEIVNDAVILLDREWRLAYLNRAALANAGRPAEEMLGRVLWDLYPGLIGTSIEAAYRKTMNEGVATYVEAPGVVSGRWYDIHVYPSRDGIVVYGRDATRRKLAETALRESEEQFRAQYENLPVPTYTWRRAARGGDASGDGAGSGADSEALTLISFNAAAVEATRGQVRGLLGTDARDLYRHQPDIPQLMHDCVVRRTAFRRDMRYKMVTTGEIKDYSVTFAYVPPDLVMVHTEDVTAQRQAERELKELNATLEQRVAEQTAALRARSRELEGAQASLRQSEGHYREVAEHNRRLARELEHRVGNHLAGLLALVREMSQRGVDAADFSRAIEDRLVALSHVHRLLASEGWRAVRLGVLVEFLLAALRSAAPQACEVASGGPDIIIESAQATALGMILTEWFTNSIKYGVHSAPGGRLDVHWEFENPDGIDTSQTWIRVTWIERGGPPISGPVVPSLGTELVQGFASRELRGRSELTFPPEGATHRIAFPVRASATTVSRSPSLR